MKRTVSRIGILFVIMAITINLCGLSAVFASDGKQIELANSVQPIKSVKDLQLRGIGVLPVYYTVVNVKAIAPDWVDVGVADGIPAMTIGINKSKTIAVTYSATFGATYGQINTAVGWTYGQDVTISIAGHYYIPKIYNGHKVKSGTLIAYAERSKKSYQVERHNEVGGITRSTGMASTLVNHLRYKVILYFVDGGSATLSV